MRKKIIYLFLLSIPVAYGLTTTTNNESNELPIKEVPTQQEVVSETYQLYLDMDIENIISFDAFEQAMVGYNNIDVKKKDIITLIDFTKPSTEERLFVLDLKSRNLILSSLVAHGRKSGENYATSFSNEVNSHQSSLGFYLTDNTYQGKNGYSLFINGLEKGINDKARQRAVVIHAAGYANPSVVKSGGRLGRSYGCPALPEAINDKVINLIKGGTLLYIYADNKNYMNKSSILQSFKI